MNSQLGVCMVISSFYPEVGGAERQAQELAKRLVERGVDVQVLTRRYQGLESHEEIDGVPVYRVPIVGTGIPAALSYVFFALLWLSRNQDRFELMHCHQPLSPATIGVLAKLLWRKKMIVKIALRGIQDLPLYRLRKRLLRSTDVFIVLNEESRTRLTEAGLGAKAIANIPNGVNPKKFTPVSKKQRLLLRKELGLPPEEKIVVFVGRLIPRKGVDILLQAWRETTREVTNAHLVIVGDGPQASSLRHLAAELEVENRLLFVGHQESVVEYLQTADVFAFPSLAEGLSNSLLEAMACGLPVVATNVEGNREAIISGQNGLLVDPGDPSQLAQALSRVITEEGVAAQLAQRARQTATMRYSLESVVEKYISLYQGLATNQSLNRIRRI